MTFGPRETDETVQYHILKKQNDTSEVRKGLQEQIHNNYYDNSNRNQRMVEMDKHNILRAQTEVAKQLSYNKNMH